MKIKSIKISFLFLFILVWHFAFSQSPMGIPRMNRSNPILLEQADYAIMYKMSFITDVTKPQEVKTGEYALLIGRNYSKFFNKWYLDNPVSELNTAQSRGGSVPLLFGQGLAGTEVYKNSSNGSMLVTTILSGGGGSPIYQYTENIPVMTWKIENEQKIIQGYRCQKAITRFLGRDYVAWFAPDIPLSNGPWKFGGLPGLILQVSDTRNHYVFEAIKIEGLFSQMSYKPGEENTQGQSLGTIGTKQRSINMPIVKYGEVDRPFRDITRQSLNELIELMHLDFWKYLGGNVTGDRLPPFPYNPIELE